MSLIDDVGLAPLPADLVRVEDRLNDAVRADDRFLGDVAGHLLAAGRQAAPADPRAVRGIRRGRRAARRRPRRSSPAAPRSSWCTSARSTTTT